MMIRCLVYFTLFCCVSQQIVVHSKMPAATKRGNRTRRNRYKYKQAGGFYPSVMGNLLKTGYVFITPCIINAVKLFQNYKTRRGRRH
jgi:hypothetical protein